MRRETSVIISLIAYIHHPPYIERVPLWEACLYYALSLGTLPYGERLSGWKTRTLLKACFWSTLLNWRCFSSHPSFPERESFFIEGMSRFVFYLSLESSSLWNLKNMGVCREFSTKYRTHYTYTWATGVLFMSVFSDHMICNWYSLTKTSPSSKL